MQLVYKFDHYTLDSNRGPVIKLGLTNIQHSSSVPSLLYISMDAHGDSEVQGYKLQLQVQVNNGRIYYGHFLFY